MKPTGQILKELGIEPEGKVQRFVDIEVLRLCDPYAPMDKGNLILSGIRGTDIGSGQVVYDAPYAKVQYYHGRGPGTSDKGRLRGRMWFERMKADHGQAIIKGAKKMMGGR